VGPLAGRAPGPLVRPLLPGQHATRRPHPDRGPGPTLRPLRPVAHRDGRHRPYHPGAAGPGNAGAMEPVGRVRALHALADRLADRARRPSVLHPAEPLSGAHRASSVALALESTPPLRWADRGLGRSRRGKAPEPPDESEGDGKTQLDEAGLAELLKEAK